MPVTVMTAAEPAAETLFKRSISYNNYIINGIISENSHSSQKYHQRSHDSTSNFTINNASINIKETSYNKEYHENIILTF